jgi:hypothetical protein
VLVLQSTYQTSHAGHSGHSTGFQFLQIAGDTPPSNVLEVKKIEEEKNKKKKKAVFAWAFYLGGSLTCVVLAH